MIESTVVNFLVAKEDFAKRVVPYLRNEYFEDTANRLVFDGVSSYYEKHGKHPSKEALMVSLSKTISDENRISVADVLRTSYSLESDTEDWLFDETEEWIRIRAVQIAVLTSIDIIDGKDSKRTVNGIPKLLEDALAVTLDPRVGHDFIEDAPGRVEYYDDETERIPSGVAIIDEITRGGWPRKTLNVLLGGTGFGKTLAMCSFAAHAFSLGKNVLYITLEISEEEISSRIDANLMNVPLNDVSEMKASEHSRRIDAIRKKTNGRLIVKEYPTAGAHVGHFLALLHELKIKKSFVPDLILVDYLNICLSSRLKDVTGGMYSYVKAIAEELRGLATRVDVPIVTGSQFNRSGMASSDPELTDTSESVGTTFTADLILGGYQSEDLARLSQCMWKQLKNRYSDMNRKRRFVTGMDKPKMRLYDIDDPTTNVVQDQGISHSEKSDGTYSSFEV